MANIIRLGVGTGGDVDIPSLAIHEGKINTSGIVETDSDYYYTDSIPCPKGRICLDFGDIYNSDAMIAFYDTDDSFIDYWGSTTRYRVLDFTNDYQDGRKMKLSFPKTALTNAEYMDFEEFAVYSGNPLTKAVLIGGEKYIVPVTLYDNLIFNNEKPGTFPFTVNSDYEILVDFTIPTYYSNMPIIGNTTSANYPALTEYGNKYYTTNGSGETNFTAELTGRHSFKFNSNGEHYFDNTKVSDYTPMTDSTIYLTVGSRGDLNRYGYYLRGIIHEYKITSISTGNIIADYKPAKVFDYIGLYDHINNSFIGCGTSVSNNT